MIDWADEFISWLQRNNLYEPYLEAHHCCNDLPSLRRWLEGKMEVYYIEDSFCWEKTRQGLNFWDQVDEFWYGYVENKGVDSPH